MAGEVLGVDEPLSLIDSFGPCVGALELQPCTEPFSQLDLHRIIKRVGIRLTTRGRVPIAVYPGFRAEPALLTSGVESHRPGVPAYPVSVCVHSGRARRD